MWGRWWGYQLPAEVEGARTLALAPAALSLVLVRRRRHIDFALDGLLLNDEIDAIENNTKLQTLCFFFRVPDSVFLIFCNEDSAAGLCKAIPVDL